MRLRWSLALIVVVTSGCFSFHESSVVQPGENARVTLRISRFVGSDREEPITVEGVVVSSTLDAEAGGGGDILLAQRTKQVIGSFREVVTIDTVQVLQPDYRLLEVRRFSWVKSGVGAVVVGFLGRALVTHFRPSDGGR